MNPNPWCDRFKTLLDRSAIKQRATVAAVRLANLSGESPERAKDLLRAALEAVHVVTDQELDVLQRLVNRAYAYVQSAYPNMDTFASRIQAERIELDVAPPICLTGLAGTGKSALLGALARALPSDEVISLGKPFTTPFELNALKTVSVKSMDSLSQILNPFLPLDCQPRNEVGADGTPHLVHPKIPNGLRTELATRRSYAFGHATHVLEELQFLTGSQGANTKVVQALMTMSYLQTPLIYAANYSLCHRLLKRPQEERDRLLADLTILLPEMPGSEGLLALLSAYQVVMQDILSFELKDEVVEIYNMTAGIKRKIKQLIVAGYEQFRISKDEKMTMSNLREGYRSRNYSAMRKDVTAILEQAMARKMARGRHDLWCPFDADVNNLQAMAQAANDQASRETGKRIQEEALGAAQRTALALARSAMAKDKNEESKGGKVVSLATGSRSPKTLDAKTLLAETLAPRKPRKDEAEV
jgi:hypothetical protein